MTDICACKTFCCTSFVHFSRSPSVCNAQKSPIHHTNRLLIVAVRETEYSAFQNQYPARPTRSYVHANGTPAQHFARLNSSISLQYLHFLGTRVCVTATPPSGAPMAAIKHAAASIERVPIREAPSTPCCQMYSMLPTTTIALPSAPSRHIRSIRSPFQIPISVMEAPQP